MCGGGGGYSSGQAEADRLRAKEEAKAERLAAEQEAQSKANSETAAARVRKRKNSLLATGAQGVTKPGSTSSILASGKSTLGGA